MHTYGLKIVEKINIIRNWYFIIMGKVSRLDVK